MCVLDNSQHIITIVLRYVLYITENYSSFIYYFVLYISYCLILTSWIYCYRRGDHNEHKMCEYDKPEYLFNIIRLCLLNSETLYSKTTMLKVTYYIAYIISSDALFDLWIFCVNVKVLMLMYNYYE